MELLLPLWKPKRRFTGQWSDRLNGLFDCGVDYAGKSILDIGCNMGIVAYEIAKEEPSFVHGFDRTRSHITVAQTIFLAVPVESRFERIELAGPAFERALRPSYDITLMLAVYHHVRRKAGAAKAQNMLRLVAKRSSTIILRDPGSTELEIEGLLAEHHFSVDHRSEKPERIGRLTVFRKG